MLGDLVVKRVVKPRMSFEDRERRGSQAYGLGQFVTERIVSEQRFDLAERPRSAIRISIDKLIDVAFSVAGHLGRAVCFFKKRVLSEVVGLEFHLLQKFKYGPGQ